jgi:hypothetical protein
MAVYQRPVHLGYRETKDVGLNPGAEVKGPQLKRYREALPNIILTNYFEFHWYVSGDHRAKDHIWQPEVPLQCLLSLQGKTPREKKDPEYAKTFKPRD